MYPSQPRIYSLDDLARHLAPQAQGSEAGLGFFGGPSAIGGSPQPTKVRAYRGVNDSIRMMKRAILSPRGAMSPIVRFCAEDIVAEVSPKDYLSECLAIRYWVNAHVDYTRDPAHVEWIRDPQALIEAMRKSRTGRVRADCDEFSSLCSALWLALGNTVELVTVGFDPPPAADSHVFSRCLLPKMAAGTKPMWMVCDPVAGTKEASMLRSYKTFHTFGLN